MGENTSKLVTYLCLDRNNTDQLAHIRHWKNLEIGYEENLVWVKYFSDVQLNSIEVKSIPAKQIYYEKEAQLYLQGSLLPDRSVPAITWTKISKALPVHLPILNHNYFGTKDKIKLSLIPDQKPKEAFVLCCSLSDLNPYIEQAPSIRLKNLKWCLIEDEALILGQPTLPIQGTIYWKAAHFLIPAGFDFNYPSLCQTLNKAINPKQQHWILFNKDSSYQFIKKTKLRTLSISSYRRSTQ